MIAQNAQTKLCKKLIKRYDGLLVTGGADRIIDERTQYKAGEWVKTHLGDVMKELKNVISSTK